MRDVVWETFLECQYVMFMSLPSLSLIFECFVDEVDEVTHVKTLTSLYSHSQEPFPAHHIKCQYFHNPQTHRYIFSCFIFSP